MAEQISHHVVNNSESASASAPADVAANQTIITSADNGDDNNAHLDADSTTTPPFSASSTDNLDHVKTENKQAAGLNGHGHAELEAVERAAEPSAGEAAGLGSEVPIGDQFQVEDKEQVDDGGLVNGMHDAASQSDEPADEGSTADLSASSDVDAGRGDELDKKDGTHHARTNSVKKPATFSKVSVTKSFLAKSTTPVPAVAKLGNKPGPASAEASAPAATLKPRLVAKTTALQNMLKPRIGVEGPTGPDASKVWNKNRPVAPPPPKQFTDEELKQQYGIHLATRLQTDEGGKESKWADIDDDEDDWAPESVVWMDGTKSTLSPAEETSLQKSEEQPNAQLPQTALPSEDVKPSLAVLKTPIDSGPPKTILKPGIAAQQAKQQNGATSTSGGQDKLSLKAKDSMAAPTKSPWAPLPPIEAVSPINPPVQQPVQSMQPMHHMPSQDARAYESAPHHPAREIAADTFDRSWREGEGGTRELFNASNGRYEQAPEGRRRSVKPDEAFRKPSVLQRPSQSGAAPAEPSPAFQTRTNSQVDGAPLGLRRGSSVSQGSGLPPGRRMSTTSKVSDMHSGAERRPSMVVGHDLHPSPASARAEPQQRPGFPQHSAWDLQMPPQPQAGQAQAQAYEVDDAVKKQERVMREGRELAKKRRAEEERRAEKEKQERLRARLAALEGAGKSRKEREAEAAAGIAAALETPTVEKINELAAPISNVQAIPSSQKTAEATVQSISTTADTQMPQALPQPVQAPQALPEEILPLPTPLPSKHEQQNHSERPALLADQAQHQGHRAHISPRANTNAPFNHQQQQQSSPYRAPNSAYPSPSGGDRNNKAQQSSLFPPFSANERLAHRLVFPNLQQQRLEHLRHRKWHF